MRAFGWYRNTGWAKKSKPTLSLHYLVKYLCHKIACSVRCGNLAKRWTLQNPDTWQAAAAILNKMYWLLLLSLSSCISFRYCLELLADDFPVNSNSLIKSFIYLIIGYGLRKLMTESPDKEQKGMDWITLSRSYLKSGCSSAMHHSVITRTVRGPN